MFFLANVKIIGKYLHYKYLIGLEFKTNNYKAF